MPGGLMSRRRAPQWTKQREYLELVEEVFEGYLQHKTYEQIVADFNLNHPLRTITVAQARKMVARAKAISLGVYAHGLQQLTELFVATRESINRELWQEVRRVEADGRVSRGSKAYQKSNLFKVMLDNQSAIEELLGARNVPTSVTNESKTLNIVVAGDDAASRIAGMREILAGKLEAPKEIVIEG